MEREKEEGGSRVEKRETDGGWCKLWMQPAISKRKRKAEKPQVMHIRLRIYHIFLSWSLSKLIYNLARVCVWERERSAYTFTHVEFCGAVLCCQAYSELDMTSKAVFTFTAPLCCFALYSVLVHTYHFLAKSMHMDIKATSVALRHSDYIGCWLKMPCYLFSFGENRSSLIIYFAWAVLAKWKRVFMSHYYIPPLCASPLCE